MWFVPWCFLCYVYTKKNCNHVTNWTALPTVWKQVSHGMQPLLYVGTAKGNKNTTWKVWEPANKRADALRTRLCNISRKVFYKVVAKQTLCNVACYQREITKAFEDCICSGGKVLPQQQETKISLNFETELCRLKAWVQFTSITNMWNDTKITKHYCVQSITPAA
jgi:hypothetical protein